jgi:hypothetical protein
MGLHLKFKGGLFPAAKNLVYTATNKADYIGYILMMYQLLKTILV